MSCSRLLRGETHAMVESTANFTTKEVDEAVEMKDPTGGRGVNSEIGEKLEVKEESEEEILKSAV